MPKKNPKCLTSKKYLLGGIMNNILYLDENNFSRIEEETIKFKLSLIDELWEYQNFYCLF